MSESIVVQRKTSTSVLLLVLIIMNAVAIFTAITYYQRVTDLERTIKSLQADVKVLSVQVSDLSRAYKPVSVAFEYYTKFMMAKILSDMLGIPIEQALKIIGNYTSYSVNATMP